MPALWPTQSPSATPRLPDGPNLPASPSVPPAPLVLSSPNVPTGSWPSPSPPAVRSPPTDWCRNWPRRTRCLDASCPDAFFNPNLFPLLLRLLLSPPACLPSCLSVHLFLCAQNSRPPPTLAKSYRLFLPLDSQPQTHLSLQPRTLPVRTGASARRVYRGPHYFGPSQSRQPSRSASKVQRHQAKARWSNRRQRRGSKEPQSLAVVPTQVSQEAACDPQSPCQRSRPSKCARDNAALARSKGRQDHPCAQGKPHLLRRPPTKRSEVLHCPPPALPTSRARYRPNA